MTKKAPSAARQRQFAAMLKSARAGDDETRWLHALVVKSAYAPVAQGAGDMLLGTAKQLAGGFGVTERTIRAWIREGMPQYRAALGNRPALFDVFAVMRWRDEREAARRALSEEGMLQGGSSQWLEEYRKQKARQAKRENDMAEKELISGAEVASQLAEIARVFRAEAEAITRVHGGDVGKDIMAMIDRAEGDWTRSLHQAVPAPVAPPAKKPVRRKAKPAPRKKKVVAKKPAPRKKKVVAKKATRRRKK